MGRWWLRNRWDNLTFVHWQYEPSVVQALLPDGLEVDTFDGKAYVSLVPFQMNRATPRFLPSLPWLSSFAETNVRTYVVDSAGNRAIWFFSLEADRLPVVALGRWLFRFPYIWSDLTVQVEGAWRRYETWARRWPARIASTTAVAIEIGDEIAVPSDLDIFLTARWGTVTKWPTRNGRLRHHPVDHPAWQLHDASLLEYHDEAFVAAGLPTPSGVPIVRWVATIDARFGRPIRV